MNIKHKHHFVSQFYLKQWENSESKILMWNGKNNFKPKPSRAESIGYSKNLYKITPLKAKQEELFHSYIKANKLEELSTYRLVCKEVIKTQKLSNSISLLAGKLNIELPKVLNDINKDISFNTFEEKFSYEESNFSRVLNKIINGKSSLITINDYDILIHFFAFQLTKTPKKLNAVMNLDKHMDFYKDYKFTKDEHNSFTIMMTQCLMERFYLSWLSDMYEIRIYVNNSNINFITSDDPCFNQKHLEKSILIQLPISPTLMIELTPNSYSKEQTAILFNYLNSKQSEANNISVNNSLVTIHNFQEKDVIALNLKMVKNKDRFVYAKSHQDLDSLI